MNGTTHFNCLKEMGLDGQISVWEYEGIIRKAILALKYKYATKVESELLWYLKARLTEDIVPDTKTFVPIPLHWYRQNTRGFNQSVEVGKAIAEHLDKKFMPDLLLRVKKTRPQTELKRDERRSNLKGVFAMNSKYRIPDSVILFDDVFTTGSTLKEAAEVLKRAGVKQVWGLTIAR
jgi:ComF family protein